MKIREIKLTPIAFRDPPLLNAVGVHEPWALRTIIEVHTDEGLSGLGETYGDAGHLARLHKMVPVLVGQDVYALNAIHALVAKTLGGAVGGDRHGLTGQINLIGTIDRVFSSFEVALLDIQGKAIGRPVSDLLGGTVRDRVPYSAYLFYKWAGHPGEPPDAFGEALDADGIVAQARSFIQQHGFTAIKLKGGVFAPEQEVAAVHALHKAFPQHKLRIDPNTAWTVDTSLRVARELQGVLEYLEDPTPGIADMGKVAKRAGMPLATNMCVVSFDHIEPAVRHGAIQVLLSDHHYWGGLTRSRQLAQICETFGIGLSMHSNSHLGISLTAMTHLAAATPNLDYACDTHYPWNSADEVIEGGALKFVDGSLPVSTAPGLGVSLDYDALARAHERYRQCGIQARDDTAYMQRFHPQYSGKLPRW
ncbi:MAG: glucarate dehydratase [Rhodanobacter sp.]|nr:MAG: glucarate dehydratase [Rhodanobacter sp.]